jgi:hypothetical protein
MGPPILVDLDADGDLDVISKTWADTDRDLAVVVAWENDGTGHFIDRQDAFVGFEIGLGGSIRGIDYDNDGDQDLVMSQTGPLLLLENRSSQGQPFTFVDQSTMLPPYYTVGGNIHGSTFETCYGVDASPGTQRCYPRSIDIGDVDGDGRLDILTVSRKGMNDVLFNNTDGEACDSSAAWCARTGFLSARTDLGIAKAFPTSDTTGYGQYNRAQSIKLVGDLTASGQPDVIVISSPTVTTTFVTDVLFSNQITSLPYGQFCDTNEDCTTIETYAATNGLPELTTCQSGSDQFVVGGWFEMVDGAFPLRGGATPVAPYANLGCSAFGDINGDGYEDVAVFTSTGEYYPELKGVQSLKSGDCARFTGDTGDTCDVYFTCYTNRCAVENPDGLHVGGPGAVYADTRAAVPRPSSPSSSTCRRASAS